MNRWYIRAHFGRFLGVRLAWDEGHSASRLDGIQVPAAQVGHVCRYFPTPEVLGGPLDEWDEVSVSLAVHPLIVHAHNYLRLNADHQTQLDPFVVVHLAPVLLVESTDEAARAEA